MSLRDSQFGRFGAQVWSLLGLRPAPGLTASGADTLCANLLGHDKPPFASGSGSVDWLTRQGYLAPGDARCTEWSRAFSRLQAEHEGIALLPSNHGKCLPVCVHELIPSTLHRPLYGWFDLQRVVALNPDGASPLSNVELDLRTGRPIPADWTPVPQSACSVAKMLWILDESGQILVGPEHFGVVKHSSIAAGQCVWAAGEIGFQNGKIRVINLSSGHYHGGRTPAYRRDILKPFVQAVFEKYNSVFLRGSGLNEFDIDLP